MSHPWKSKPDELIAEYVIYRKNSMKKEQRIKIRMLTTWIILMNLKILALLPKIKKQCHYDKNAQSDSLIAISNVGQRNLNLASLNFTGRTF